jgi:hypothetical protein
MKKLTDLIGLELTNQEGVKLGHIFDLRSPGEPEAGSPNANRVVAEIVYGLPGFLERIGLKQADHKIVTWESVLEIHSDHVVVDISTPRKPKGS